ncbi:MAG: hypothetical protein WBM17_00165 [Anaerolineales bacterium]
MKTSLIDRYVKEVGRRLPRKTRGDVEAELRSLLTDSLRDRAAGKEPLDAAALEAEQIAVLEALGPPQKAAARYAPPQRHLIGPNVYDFYTIVLFAAGIGVATVVLLLVGLTLLGGNAFSGGFLPTLGDLLGLLFQWLLMAFGSITLVFAVVGRLLPEDAAAEEKEEAWDPRTLPEVNDWTRIDARGILFESVCIIAALAVFNLFPQWVGLNFPASVNGEPSRWYSIPLLSDAFFKNFLPFWNVNFLLSILLNLFLLRRGRWQRVTRVLDFLLGIFGIVLIAAMLSGPTLINVKGVADESLKSLLGSIGSSLLTALLIVVLIVAVFDSFGKLAAIFRTHPMPYAQPFPADDKPGAGLG